ncbi:MAG: GH3 auxin-responsive promoter family protein [Aureispira sp.]|nr:GH3 auxin-responsive promoter family protein [Aureispira sp.]
MSLKTFIVRKVAEAITKRIQKDSKKAVKLQERWMQKLVKAARNTVYGKDHHFDQIRNYEDFKKQVPLADYEQLRPYIDQINAGKSDVLWPKRPKYYAKTSGTTSGAKYIPLTKQSIPNHFNTARNALFNYVATTGKGDFLDGKLIFLSGSPTLEKKDDILLGRLSGISNHLVPSWLKKSQLPSYETNCIEEWEAKLDKIVEETANEDMRLISGIPPWVQMYYERLLEYTGKKTVLEVFPNFSMFVYGGVNFEPYRAKLEELVGGKIPSVETYPASEGFLAFQDLQDDKGLLLNVNSGIFFEFVPATEIFDDNPTRISLKDVELGVNYAIIINSNAGLWGYNIGDTVEFITKDPYRLIVTGRIKHFISAFGEHVIGKEVETAMNSTAQQLGIRTIEYTVAPQVSPTEGGLPYHEWFVAFDNLPTDLNNFAQQVDKSMQEQNIYYKDLINSKVLQPLKIRPLRSDAFREYMKSIGKLGGQNKVPRLANDRKIADFLTNYIQD